MIHWSVRMVALQQISRWSPCYHQPLSVSSWLHAFLGLGCWLTVFHYVCELNPAWDAFSLGFSRAIQYLCKLLLTSVNAKFRITQNSNPGLMLCQQKLAPSPVPIYLLFATVILCANHNNNRLWFPLMRQSILQLCVVLFLHKRMKQKRVGVSCGLCSFGRGLLDTLHHHAGSGRAAFVLHGMLPWAVCQLRTHFRLEDSTHFTRSVLLPFHIDFYRLPRKTRNRKMSSLRKFLFVAF